VIPLRDRNPSGTFPAVTLAIIAANIGVFLHELMLGPSLRAFIGQYALIPAQVRADLLYGEGAPLGPLIPFFTSMFLHGGWLHLIGNMWFLWIFGDNVEDVLGSFRYALFYVACGLGAAAIHFFTAPNSQVPTLGASGAIAGVLGAYLVLFPRARVVTLVPIFFYLQLMELPAVLVLGLWFLLQLLSGSATIGAAVSGGIAWWAHVGGFLAGMLLILLVRPRKVMV
jgi:rhomboid family protein